MNIKIAIQDTTSDDLFAHQDTDGVDVEAVTENYNDAVVAGMHAWVARYYNTLTRSAIAASNGSASTQIIGCTDDVEYDDLVEALKAVQEAIFTRFCRTGELVG